MSNTASYSVKNGASMALEALLKKCRDQLPRGISERIGGVKFKSSSEKGDVVLFPCPLKQQEAVGAIKGLEGVMASALANLRPGLDSGAISVDMMKVACFISSAYITTVDGWSKSDPEVKGLLPGKFSTCGGIFDLHAPAGLTIPADTDLNQAQSNVYRRLSAGMYGTKDGKYYHIHGSLEASTTLEMIGLPAHNVNLTDYNKCVEVIEGAVKRFTASELEKLNLENGQAGVEVLKHEEFLDTPHGKVMKNLPPFTVRSLEIQTKKVPLKDNTSSSVSARQVLRNVRVLELCRIIAGPTIGRSLAALGADVLKVTCDRLPDVPFFQVDGNTGKQCISLDLGVSEDRTKFEKLLEDADVVIDGYRPGSLDKWGCGASGLAERAETRGKGYVYVAEDCFGGTDDIKGRHAEWAHRRGWQQIADCVTGVAWEQGKFMNKDEPVIPPFPMSDYGTGALGCVAALVGLYNRTTKGGSWACRTSLVQYDLFLLSLGVHSDDVQKHLREKHSEEFFEIRYHDSVDRVGQEALKSINRVHSNPFDDESLMQTALSMGFGGAGGADIRWPREAVEIGGLDIGHVRVTRANGDDDDEGWEGWERDKELLTGMDMPGRIGERWKC